MPAARNLSDLPSYGPGRGIVVLQAVAIVLVVFLPLTIRIQIPFIGNDLQGLLAFLSLCLLSIGFLVSSYAGRAGLVLAKEDTLLLLLFIWMLLALAASSDQTVATTTTLRWLYCIIGFLLVRSLVRHDTTRSGVEWLMVAGGGMFAGGFILHMSDVIAPASDGLIYPFVLNRNYVAQLMVLPLACGISLLSRRRNLLTRRSLLLVPVIFLIATAILLSRSRGVWVGLLAATSIVLPWLLIQGRMTPRMAGYGLGIVIALLVATAGILQSVTPALGLPTPLDTLRTFLDLESGSIGGRLNRWQNGWPMLIDHLWLGVGPGQWELVFHQYRHGVVVDPLGYAAPFNAWLRLAAECGVPAFIALAGWIVLLVRRHLVLTGGAAVYGAALITVAIAACFHSSFSIRLLHVNFFVIAGVLASSHSGGLRSVRSIGNLPVLLMCGTLLGMLPWQARVFGAKLGYASISDQYRVVPRWQQQRHRLKSIGDEAGVGRVIDNLLDRDKLLARTDYIQRYGVGRQHNIALLLAGRASADGSVKDAARYYRMALTREPANPAGYLGYCRQLMHEGALADAERVCADGIARSHHDVDLMATLASIYRQRGRPEDAKRKLDLAISSLGFLSSSSPTGRVGERKQQARRRQAGDTRTTLEAIDDVGPLLSNTAGATLLHKKIARYRDDILVASNQSGRFELWRVAPDGGATRLSGDDYVYFRPEVSEKRESVYFLSDTNGDGVFFLYQRHLETGRVSLLGRHFLNTSVGGFALSPDQNSLVYQAGYRRNGVLWLVDLSTGDTRWITGDLSTKRDPAWAPDGSSVIFVRNHREVVEIRTGSGDSRLIFSSGSPVHEPVVSPSGNSILLISRENHGPSQIILVDRSSGSSRTLVKNTEGLLSPLWIDNDRFLYREKSNDAYLPRIYSVSQGRSLPVGPREGVVYRPELDRHGENLVAIHADPSSPGRLWWMSLKSMDGRHGWLPDGYDTLQRLPMRRQVVENNQLRTPVYTVWPKQTALPSPAVIWLHGSSSGLSPRWHPYAQFFARAGIAFTGVNYLSELGDQATMTDRLRAVQNAYQVLADSGQVDMQQVFIIGVSSGSVVARQFTSRYPELVSGLIEYSPAGNWRDTIEDRTSRRAGTAEVPRLLFWGENDIRYRNAGINPDLLNNRLSSALIDHIVMADEGHDIRRSSSIERRLQLTMSFIRDTRLQQDTVKTTSAPPAQSKSSE